MNNQIEQKLEEKMSRTLEINSAKVQALKELGYTSKEIKNYKKISNYDEIIINQ